MIVVELISEITQVHNNSKTNKTYNLRKKSINDKSPEILELAKDSDNFFINVAKCKKEIANILILIMTSIYDSNFVKAFENRAT